MRYAQIPGIDRRAAVICIGTDRMGTGWDVDFSWRILDMYAELGGNFIDTARVYGLTDEGVSLSEKCVGGWLKSRGMRDKMILGTKGAHYSLKDRSSRLGRADIFSDCEESLRDLKVDFIDMYWLHRDDESRTVEEIIDTLNELIKRGVIGAIGASNWSAARLREANAYAARSGQKGFSADQPQFSLARQVVCGDPTLVQMHDELYNFHAETGMPVVPFSSQAKGFYSKLDAGGVESLNPKGLERFAFDENIRKLPLVREIAAAHGVSVGAVALGYLTCQPFPVFPIVGISREEYMDDVRQAADLVLTADEVQALRRA